MAYFPNGSSGEVLEIQCGRCPLGDGPCPVVGIQMLYNYDQLDDGQEKLKYAMSMLVDDQGICQVHKQLMENITVVRNDSEVCEHGIEDGEYCKECNAEYKRAAQCDGE